jgi:PAS domain S-box-containing protein
MEVVSEVVFIAIFLATVAHAARRPTRPNLDTTLLFGAVALVVAERWLTELLQVPLNRILGSLVSSLVMALPYLLLRLLHDLARVPWLLMRSAELGLACSVILLFALGSPLPAGLALTLIAYVVVLETYAATRFMLGARHARGVTRRRMQAIAVGSVFLGVAILGAGLQASVPTLALWWAPLGVTMGAFLSGIGYLVGFAPAAVLRRAWQQPELLAFIRTAAGLSEQREVRLMLSALELAAARALGAPKATIALWDDPVQVLNGAEQAINREAFATQHAVFAPVSSDAATSALAVPITVGQTRLGVLIFLELRPLIFVEDDVHLAQRLADQVGLSLGYVGERTERERAQFEIVAHRHTEAALRESEARTTSILEASLDGIVTIDHEGRVVEFNPAAERTFGYRRAEVLGRILAETILPPAYAEQHRRGLAHYLATGEARMLNRRVEVTALRADRTEISVELAITRIATSGPPMFTGFIRDISRRKEAETAIRQFAAIVETAQDAIIGKTLDGVITSWNPGAERLYGYTADEAIGRSISLLLPPERGDELTDILDRLSKNERIDHYETLRQRKDQTVIDVSLSISPIKDADGQVVGAATIARDITERKQAATRIQELNIDLERRVVERTSVLADTLEQLKLAHVQLEQEGWALQRANKHKSDFLASMSHELRTPLNAIIGFSEVMLDRTESEVSTEQRKAFLGHIQGSGRHLLSLVDDLLDLSKVEAGGMDLRPEHVSLAGLIDDCVTITRAMASAKRISFQTRCDPPDAAMTIDPARLKQMVYNLLSNAVKFTPDGGRVSVETQVTEDEAILTVRDNGVGIKPEDQALIFEEFRQGDLQSPRGEEGTGLGLAVVSRLAELHGGKVGVKSVAGQGSTFTFVLPMATAAAHRPSQLSRR